MPLSMLMRLRVPLFRVSGIPVEANWSFVLIVLWTVNGLALSVFPSRYPDLSGGTVATMALVTTALMWVSLLLHELGHAFQARREGLRVHGIILYFLGGLAVSSGRRSITAGLRVVAAGPLVTMLLAGLFAALAWGAQRAGWGDAVRGTAVVLTTWNLFLLGFNLLPIFPLDGGQLFQLSLLRLRRDVGLAARWTTRAGWLAVGALFIVGFVGPLVGLLPAAAPRFIVSGFSLMIAAFVALLMMSQTSPAYVTVGPRTLSERTVRDLLRPEPGLAEEMLRRNEAVAVPSQASLQAAFDALGAVARAVVVLDRKGNAAGIVGRAELADAILKAKDSERGQAVHATPAGSPSEW